jgi:hypothetical protein
VPGDSDGLTNAEAMNDGPASPRTILPANLSSSVSTHAAFNLGLFGPAMCQEVRRPVKNDHRNPVADI